MKNLFSFSINKLNSMKPTKTSDKKFIDFRIEKNGLGNYLLAKGLIDQNQLKCALEYQSKNNHKKIGEILAEINILGDAEILKELATYMEVPYVILDTLTSLPSNQSMFKKKVMLEKEFVPFDISGSILSIAISDINNAELKSWIESTVNSGPVTHQVSFYLCLPNMIKNYILNSYNKYAYFRHGTSNKKFGEYLIENKLISKEKLDEVLAHQQKYTHKRIGELLFDLNLLDSEQLLKSLSAHMNKEYKLLNDVDADPELIKLFDLEFMKEHNFVPFDKKDDTIYIAVNNIFDDELLDAIQSTAGSHGLKTQFFLSLVQSIQEHLKKAKD